MTSVIGGPAQISYSRAMATTGRNELEELIAEQVQLEERINDLRSSPHETLAAGKAFLAFAAREDQVFDALASLLDPVVRAELRDEHEQIAEDLEVLGWLLETTPDSPDVAVLTVSLIRRMRQHIHRDGRLLARAVAMKR
jgi:acyl-CoA hydrolase